MILNDRLPNSAQTPAPAKLNMQSLLIDQGAAPFLALYPMIMESHNYYCTIADQILYSCLTVA